MAHCCRHNAGIWCSMAHMSIWVLTCVMFCLHRSSLSSFHHNTHMFEPFSILYNTIQYCIFFYFTFSLYIPDASFGLIRNENGFVWFRVNANSVSESFEIQSVWMRNGIIRTERVVARNHSDWTGNGAVSFGITLRYSTDSNGMRILFWLVRNSSEWTWDINSDWKRMNGNRTELFGLSLWMSPCVGNRFHIHS